MSILTSLVEHRLNDNEDIMVSHFHVILQDYVTRVKELYDWKTLKVNHHPVKFCVHRHCDSGDIIVFVCHVTFIALQENFVRNFASYMLTYHMLTYMLENDVHC